MTAGSDKRIAINSAFLYLRMLIVMIVTLFTSRVVLNVLGIQDYGIYDLVGGVVVLFAFLRSAVTTAIQRFLNMAIGQGDEELEQRVYSTSLVIFVIFIVLIAILLETVGRWFLSTQLNIPPGKEGDVEMLLQLTIATFAVTFYRTAFDALIISHERMSFYAYISLADAAVKLGSAYLLYVTPGNKLLIYGAFVLGSALIINLIYYVYTKRAFKVQPRLRMDWGLSRRMLSFSSWNVLGGISDIGYQQGTNMILNVFYGVAFNATMGITNQVKGAVFSLVSSVLTAATPQIMQKYAAGDIEGFKSLVIRMSKFAYFLIWIISVPVIINMDYLLSLWLGETPPMTTLFCRLIVIFSVLNSLTSPLWVGAQAHGGIGVYQTVVSILMLLNLPGTYLFMYLGYTPACLLYVQIALLVVVLAYRVVYLCRLRMLDAGRYVRQTLLPIAAVTIVTLPLFLTIGWRVPALTRLLVTVPSSVIFIMAAVYLIGLNSVERQGVICAVESKLRRRGKLSE